MTDKLRELTERWRRRASLSDGKGDLAFANNKCANELLSILDAEGDGGAVGNPVALLTIELDRWYVEGIRMEVEALTVPPGTYKLYPHPQPVRSGGVNDEDVRGSVKHIKEAAEHLFAVVADITSGDYYESHGVDTRISPWFDLAEYAADLAGELTALTHFAKSQGSASDDQVEFDEGDLFWPDDDGEDCAESMFNLLESLHINGQIEPGQVVRVRRARNLPSVEVIITTFENGDFCDYKLAAIKSQGESNV